MYISKSGRYRFFGIYCKVLILIPLFVVTIRKRGWHMFAQSSDKVDDSGKLYALTGAYADLGACKKGARVFFRVLAPYADEVYLIGSFNMWADNIPMEKDELGIWQVDIPESEISDGDRYKFKAMVGGENIYIRDAYAEECDGEPYFNSVYRESRAACAATVADRPLNVYEIESDKWLCYDGCREIDYGTLARELLPYLLQMGYTHVCLCGGADSKQGGEKAFDTFATTMRSASIGVLLRGNTSKALRAAADGVIEECDASEFFPKLVHKISFAGERAVNYVMDCGAYLGHFRQAPYNKKLRRGAAAMTYLLFKEGRMLTRMGREAGHEQAVRVFDRHVFESTENARFQLFCALLSGAYLANPEVWEGSGISESDSYGIRVTRRYAADSELILVTDLWGNGGCLTFPAEGEWRVILDSSRSLGYDGAVVSRENNMSIRIALEAYGAVLLERIK